MFYFLNRFFSRSPVIDQHAERWAQVFSNHITVVQCRNPRLLHNIEVILTGALTGEKRKNNWSASMIARVVNRMAWKLIDRGYPKDVMLALSKRIAVKVVQKPAKTS